MNRSLGVGRVGSLSEVSTWVDRVLDGARRTAARRGEAVWVAARVALADPAAMDALSVASPAVTWGFREPDGRLTLAWGEALEVRVDGAEALRTAASRLQALVAAANLPTDLWVGGGAAFQAGNSWRGFPDASLVLPELTVRRESDGSAWWQLVARVPPSGALRPPRLLPRVPGTAASLLGATLRTTRFVPRPERWRDQVAVVVRALDRGRVGKVVLARAVDLGLAEPVDLDALWVALTEDAGASVFLVRQAGGVFLGATPELLARVQGRRVFTQAVAGTERADANPDVLLGRPKDRREHRVVVEAIARRLGRLADDVVADPIRTVRAGPVCHLVTPVAGWLRPEQGLYDVLAALHPTPAVGGEPPGAALAWQRRLEATARGWYAGPVGLAEIGGASGAFYVGLRSAWVRGRRVRLFAGCGLVRGSNPDQELSESSQKLGVMVQALAGGEAPS